MTRKRIDGTADAPGLQVELTVDDVKQALCDFARVKAGIAGQALCKIQINGFWSVAADEPPAVVTLTPVSEHKGGVQ